MSLIPKSVLPGGDVPMEIAGHDIRSGIIMVLVAVLLANCSSLTRKSADPEELAAAAEAKMVLLDLGSQNETLVSFKGVGKVKLWQNGKKRIDERLAWIGSESDKLSIVVLISGHPAVKLATDGKWLYYYEVRQAEPVYKKLPATNATLKRILSFPIKTSDIIELLAGRTPLREHHSALLQRQNSGTGYVLTLRKRWQGIVEKIFLSDDKTQVHQIEFYNRSGALVYRARFDEMQVVKGYEVPSRLSVTNDEGVRFLLEIQNYLVDVPIVPSMFVLNPPD